MCEDFAPNFGDRRTACCITAAHNLKLPFSRGYFCQKNNMTVVTHPSYFSVSPIEDETERPQF
jgi:hypothetical protein